MAVAPSPSEIFHRAVEDGELRLDQSMLELISASFIAGFMIVVGIVALGTIHAMVEPSFGDGARIAGALAFGVVFGLVALGRTELFIENLFDPIAKVVERPESQMPIPLLRLWVVTLVVNLAGGALFVSILSIDGVLPPGTADALRSIAQEFVHREPAAGFAQAIVGGVLITLLSYLLKAVDSDSARFTLAFMVGFLVALGPFDYVVVTVLHIFFGMLSGATIGVGTLAMMIAIVTAGNLIGGLGLVALFMSFRSGETPQADD